MKTDFNFDSSGVGALMGLGEPIRSVSEGTVALADLAPGDECIVASVEHVGALGRRLVDLGLLPNTPIKVLRRAPLGDPSVYQLRGYRLCLRRVDAAGVRVRIKGAAHDAALP